MEISRSGASKDSAEGLSDLFDLRESLLLDLGDIRLVRALETLFHQG